MMEVNTGSSHVNTLKMLEINAGSSCSNTLKMMEVNNRNSCFVEKQALEGSTSCNEVKKPSDNNGSTPVFINHAAIAWHESRRKWIGDQSRRSRRMPKDPIIDWSMTYEDLLSTNECFPEPIPLPEMVDFLVDIWHDEGLDD